MTDKELTDQQAANLRAVYQELCNSYRAIDDFRAKLLGFLPLASGTGIFLLVVAEEKFEFVKPFLLPVGFFGFVVTLGLFFYELYGIKKCHWLIDAGTKIEKELNTQHGQFATHPSGIGGFINEPFAAGVVYPAVLAAWIFVALVSSAGQDVSEAWSIRVFVAGFGISLLFNIWLKLPNRIKNYVKARYGLSHQSGPARR